jgi:HEAT repeat protein
VKAEIEFTLAKIGPAAAPAVPDLMTALGSDNEDVQQRAVYALGKIGPPAAAASDILKTHLESDNDELRAISIWALLRIHPGNEEIVQLALPVLTKALGSELDVVRIEAAAALGEIGAPAQSALPELEKLLTDHLPAVRTAAKTAIDQIKTAS